MCAVPHLVRFTYSFRIEKSVSQRLSWALSHPEGAFFFSQKNTEEQNTQRFIKIAAPPPSPPPKGRGVITEIPMWGGCWLLFASSSVSTIAETLCVLCMPKAFCGLETCAKRLSELCALCERKNSAGWEKKLPSNLHESYLIERMRFISHRRTQKNRTRSIPQRHQVNRFHRTLQPPLAETLCDICMPKAFCEFKTVRKWVLFDLWVLWEKKSPLWEKELSCFFIMLLFCRQTTPFMIRKRLLICRTTGYLLNLEHIVKTNKKAK